jgi:hypothetical protein
MLYANNELAEIKIKKSITLTRTIKNKIPAGVGDSNL